MRIVEDRRALGVGLSAYLLWGLFPLYFILFDGASPVEIVAYRAFFALVFCFILVAVARSWSAWAAVLKNRRAVTHLALASFLVAGNWMIYIYGVSTGRTIDAAMGYFMNPLVSTLLGVIILGERLRRIQWFAFSLGALAVAVLIAAYHQVPWIALGLAVSFGLYGLVKKDIGAHFGALEGFATETLILAPIASGYLIWLWASGSETIDPLSSTGALAALAGPITAVPLLLFAYAAARLRLTTLGILQYVSPLMQFLLGWLVLGEEMAPARWVAFILIWVAIAIFTLDGLRSIRVPRLETGTPQSRS